jgi:hypothetical protein
MKAKSAINKIKTRLGIDLSAEVAACCAEKLDGPRVNRKVSVLWKGRVLSLYVDPVVCTGGRTAFVGADKAEISLIHVRAENDNHDMMTDYHAGSFYDNLTQALDAIEPPEPKFSVGSLVRVKPTKRAVRWNIAGINGLVIETGPHGVRILRNNGVPSSGWIRNNDIELLAGMSA